MTLVALFAAALVLSAATTTSEAKLTLDYYKTTCPDFAKIVRDTVLQKQLSNPTTAAGTLRLFFHDCMVGGCDASVLLGANHANPHTEREVDINLSLPGDAFDVIVRAKTALELTCHSTVSCADILAQATRDLIAMVGGPVYKVRLGRKDSFTALPSIVKTNLPLNDQNMNDLIKVFAKKKFTIKEMVALAGGHTIGFSHCKEFADRIFNFSRTVPTDPDIHPKFAEALKKTCANFTIDQSMSAFNDVMTPGKFDNVYYQNLKRGLGLLKADSMMFHDPRTKPFVELYATNGEEFFRDFARAMEKLSVLEIKTGRKGEVRRRCDAPNSRI